MEMLDIGGGFPGIIDFEDEKHLFYQMAHTINQSLERNFPLSVFPDLEIISEPGQYFVASAFRLLTKVVGKRFVETDEGMEYMYYLNDGIFGQCLYNSSKVCSLNCFYLLGSFLIKLWEPELIKLKPVLPQDDLESRNSFMSTLWGPTCDSSDIVAKRINMKELHVDEYLQVRERNK